MVSPVDPQRFRRAEQAFHRLLDLEPEDRERGLATLESENPTLAPEVRALLAAYEEPLSLLKTLQPRRVEAAIADSRIGQRIGAYRLVEKLGQGGMGIVYLARRVDEEYESAVSIKLLRRVLAGEGLEVRFRRERQILAQLDHPNIARLHDGGTTARGVPYFVMEYIEGTALDRHCDQSGLDPRGRLKLFLQVCAAVTYAHRRLIVHRDIKPANILVTDDGVPKLLDFGIAKLLESDGRGEETATTEDGLRPLTPKYASPEQLRAEAITTASDVYSLGVTLYRLLTGRVPQRAAPQDELPRASRSIKPTSFAGQAGSRWSKTVAGDLDVVLHKALAFEADDRYSSVEALADDLRRWLDGRPILARPPTTLYRLRKFASRNRLSTGLVAVLATVLLGYAATATYLVVRLSGERERVRLEQVRSRQAADFLAKTFEIADPESGHGAEITAQRILKRGAERVESELAAQPRLQARLLSTIAGLFGKLGLYAESHPLLEKSVALNHRHLGEDHLTTLRTRCDLGALKTDLGDFESAEKLLVQVVEQLRQQSPPAPVDLARCTTHLGFSKLRRGDFSGARAAIEESLQLHRERSRQDPVRIGDSLQLLGQIAANQGELARAEEFYTQAVASRAEVVGRLHPDQLGTLKSLASIARGRGDLDRSRSLSEEILAVEIDLWGEEHPKIAFTLTQLGLDAMQSGDLDRADSLFVQALEMRRKYLGPEHAAICPSLTVLASLRLRQQRVPEAENLYRESLELGRDVFGPGSPILGLMLEPLGKLLTRTGRAAEAEPLLREAYDLRRESMGPANPMVVSSGESLGRCLSALQRFAEAEPLLLTSYEALQSQGDSSALTQTTEALVDLYQRWPRVERAAKFRRIAKEGRGN